MAGYILPYDLEEDIESYVPNVQADLEYLLAILNSGDFLEAPFTAAQHGDLSASTSTMHSDDSIEYDGTLYLGTDVGAVLDEIGDFVGYDKTQPTLKPAKEIGRDRDNTVYTAVSGAGSYTAGSLKITVPANTAQSAIYVDFGAYVNVNGAGGNCTIYVPIRIGTTDLSTSGSPDADFHLAHGVAGAPTVATNPSNSVVIDSTSYPTLDLTIDNDISIGTIFETAAGGSLVQLASLWIKVTVV